MATQRNPSFGLTDSHVDDIVDRLLRGKYEKHRPVESLEVVRAGFISHSTARDYVCGRWGIRSSWSKDPKEGLSSAGITMRSNKLWERCTGHVQRVKGGTSIVVPDHGEVIRAALMPFSAKAPEAIDNNPAASDYQSRKHWVRFP